MAITKNDGRQSPIYATVAFTYEDFVSGTYQDAIEVPSNAVVASGSFEITEVFDSGTSDTFTVGDSADEDRYKASINGQTAAVTALVPTGKRYTAQDDVTITWTGAGAAPSQGAGMLIVEYIVVGRASHTQG